MRGNEISNSLAVLGFRLALLAGTGMTALIAASPAAYAQDAESVVVSASRITASGFDAPTPTTVMSAADLQNTAQPTIYDAVNQLPSLQGSVGLSGSPNNGSSNGLNGLSSFSLRGLGAIRTLTLIDGQRVVPANVNGTTDVALFPQLLIRRVDVVTGGASASWGSDAVGGVVNFVTDKNYTGIKGHIEAGMSNYNDDYSGLIQVAAGTSFAGGKGHIEASAEFYNNSGVHGDLASSKYRSNGRCCNYNNGTLSYTQTTTPKGVPQFTPSINVQSTSNAQ
jgi:outer membrane cobalamin receptor